jgi:hypothetical protein
LELAAHMTRAGSLGGDDLPVAVKLLRFELRSRPPVGGAYGFTVKL